MKNSIPGHEIQEPLTFTAEGNIKIWARGSDLPLNCVTTDCPITSTSFTSVTHQSFNFTDPTVSNGTHTFSSLHIFLVFLFFFSHIAKHNHLFSTSLSWNFPWQNVKSNVSNVNKEGGQIHRSLRLFCIDFIIFSSFPSFEGFPF